MEEELGTQEQRENVAFKNLRYDYKKARNAKATIDKKIIEWNDLYYGETSKNKTKRSKIVIKEVAKAIELQKPSLTEPFLSSSHPIRLSCLKSEKRAKTMEKYVNNFFTGEFDRTKFINEATDVLLREGTVWAKTGWDFRERNNRETFKNKPMDYILQREDTPSSIEQNLDGTFNVEYNKVEIERNIPTAKVQQNEHVFPDPNATAYEDLRFVIVREHMTISDMRESGLFKEDKLKELSGVMSADSREDTNLGQVRQADKRDYGGDQSYDTKDVARRKVAVLTFWGYYDLNGDGIAEPIVASWVEDKQINLRIEENPMPSKAIPMFYEVYSARPFSIWGNPPANFIGDNQIVKSSLVRGILDNMSNSNNGQKFITRGTIDYSQWKKMNNGERTILVNKIDGIKDGTYNNLPPSVFATLQMFDKETKDMTGIEAPAMAVTSADLSEDSQQLTMAQQRMVSSVRGMSNLISKIVREWLISAEAFLTNEQIEELFSKEEQVDFWTFEYAKFQKINVSVGTDVSKAKKAHQINMLMQQAKTLESGTPPETLNALTAELFEIFDMYEKAESIRNYKAPPPTQEQMLLQQVEVQKAQLEVQKLQADIEDIKVQGQVAMLNAQKGLIDAQSNAEYKKAQETEKYAKAQSHEVETALKPVEAMQSMQDEMRSSGERNMQ